MKDGDGARLVQQQVALGGEMLEQNISDTVALPGSLQHGGDPFRLDGGYLIAVLHDAFGEGTVVLVGLPSPVQQARGRFLQGRCDWLKNRLTFGQLHGLNVLDVLVAELVPVDVLGERNIREGEKGPVAVDSKGITAHFGGFALEEGLHAFQLQIDGHHADKPVLAVDGRGAGDHGHVGMRVHVGP